MGGPLLLIALFCFSAGIVEGTDLHHDFAFDTRVGLGAKWDVVLHNRARFVTATHDWYDASVIPIFRYQVHPRVRLYGGTYVTWADFGISDWVRVTRPYAGVEPTVFQSERVSVTSRTGYDRIIASEGHPDFNRYRQRFRIRGHGKWSPYANVEFLFRNDGLSSTRYAIGFRRNLSRHNGLEIGYWYQRNDLTGPGIRHVIKTTFHLNFKGLAPDF